MTLSNRFQWRQTTCSNRSPRARTISKKLIKYEKAKAPSKDRIQIKFALRSHLLSIVQKINITFHWQPLQQQLIQLPTVEHSRYHWVRINKCNSSSPRMCSQRHPFCSTTSTTTASHITHRVAKHNVQIRPIYGLVEWSRAIESRLGRIWRVVAGGELAEAPLRSSQTTPQVWWPIPMSSAILQCRHLFITSKIKIKSINSIGRLASQLIIPN